MVILEKKIRFLVGKDKNKRLKKNCFLLSIHLSMDFNLSISHIWILKATPGGKLKKALKDTISLLKIKARLFFLLPRVEM